MEDKFFFRKRNCATYINVIAGWGLYHDLPAWLSHREYPRGVMLRSRFPFHAIRSQLSHRVALTANIGALLPTCQIRALWVKPIAKSKIRIAPNALRPLSIESGTKGIDNGTSCKASIVTKWIADFNNTVAAHAEISLWTFMALRLGSWYTLAFIYTYVPEIGPELAIGYLVCKFTGKLRQPANLGLAALISHQYPILGTIKASALIGLIKNNTKNEPNKPTIVIKIEQFLDWISGPIDKYGFSYFIASKVNMAVLLLGASFAVKTGLDVSCTFLLVDILLCIIGTSAWTDLSVDHVLAICL